MMGAAGGRAALRTGLQVCVLGMPWAGRDTSGLDGDGVARRTGQRRAASAVVEELDMSILPIRSAG